MTTQTPQANKLLAKLLKLVNERDDAEWEEGDLKDLILRTNPRGFLWSTGRAADIALCELRQGIHFRFQGCVPKDLERDNWRDRVAGTNPKMVFADEDKERHSRIAEVLYNAYKDGRIKVWWEGEELEERYIRRDKKGAVSLRIEEE